MTNLEALQNSVNYPVKKGVFQKALLDRDLKEADEYSDKDLIELAFADVMIVLITSPNVTEGGFSVSLTDKQALKDLAKSIYDKHGEVSPLEPTVSSVKRW